MILVGFQNYFVDGCSAVSCDFGVFIRRGQLTSLYSAILYSYYFEMLLYQSGFKNRGRTN